VVGVGPTLKSLAYDTSGGSSILMAAAHTPDHWTPEDKASAILSILHELVDKMSNGRWKAASRAALRHPADDYRGSHLDSVAARWRELVVKEGYGEPEARDAAEKYRGYWTTAATHLADTLADRLHELNSTSGWRQYEQSEPLTPPLKLPLSFDRTDVLYRFQGRIGVQSISYRWLTAHGDVDHYETAGWYYNEPEAPVEIRPLANCQLAGPLRELPQGGRSATLAFSRKLVAGDRYFFAYTTFFRSERPCRPTILYEVRGLSMSHLTVRAQFDISAMPRRAWHFNLGVQIEDISPEDGAPELLPISPNGYVDYEFQSCQRGRKYGLRWQWDDDIERGE